MKFRWKSSGRQGSALLIVLGMFAFMLVSAVSFSIYMRSSRAPSSYVRRNASARHLVKAALVRAMDEIDCAIGNDPFPGFGYNHDYGSDGINQGDRLKNDNWHGRVFTPSNEVAHADTVSTLTLEALGYLPPCLVNEVRYWSRHTRTAKWHSFNYGLGQYAFTAVNVSDFFDLNRFVDAGGVPNQRLNRTSSEEGRVSPTYLFRGSSNSDMDAGSANASAFLSALSGGSGLGVSPSLAEVPLVSMMDFNLAVGDRRLGNVASPFMKRLNGSDDTFYSSVGDENVRCQMFMAGGWTGTNKTATAGQLENVDLSYPECQPFADVANFPGTEVGSPLTILDIYNSNNRDFWGKKSGVFGTQNIENNFPVLMQILLADYLDHDNIPLSLNLPCTEIAPMLVGIDCDPKFKITFKKDASSVQSFYDQTGQNKIMHNATFQADIEATPTVTVDVAFPFNDVKGRLINANMKYEVQVVARLFFTPTADGTLRMPYTAGYNLDFLKDADAPNQNSAVVWPTANEINDYSILWGSANVQFEAPNETDTTDPKKYIKTVNVRLPRQAHTRNLFNAWYQTSYANLLGAGVPYYDNAGQPVGTTTDVSYPAPALRFLNYDNGALSFIDLNQLPGTKIRPSMAVWVRIVDTVDNNKVVDMVPATVKCDIWNNQGMSMTGLQNMFRQYEAFENLPLTQWSVPFLRYWGDNTAEFEVTLNDIGTRADAGSAIANPPFNPKSYLAGDPRYNWAPEDWYQGVPGKWWDNVQGMLGTDGRDDFFMSVSNQGYLQSVYELMFIPRVRQLTPSSDPTFGFLQKGNTLNHSYNGNPRTALADTSHYGMMWRTYRQVDTDDNGNVIDAGKGWAGTDDLSKLNIDSGSQGMRINPYTDSIALMMGAFANMPRDWWAAGTNHTTTGKGYMNSSSFEKTHLFGWSTEYQDVYNMAYHWMGIFRRWDMLGDKENRSRLFYGTDYWKETFDESIYWYDGSVDYNIPVGVSECPNLDSGIINNTTAQPILQDMTLAERKFLYGYLKSCFSANAHQLFLVFVRAESAAGGGGAGSGARAVALVSRDPNPPMRNGQIVTASGGTEEFMYGKDNAQSYLNLQNGANEESWRLNERKYPPHKMRILFYHQLD